MTTALALAALALLALAAAPAFAKQADDEPAGDGWAGWPADPLPTEPAGQTITLSQAMPGIASSQAPPPEPSQALINIAAFLQAIERAEGTNKAADAYRVCFGYKHTIQSFRDHPAITGEWRGERLSDAHCKGAGLGPGCVSTAAGRFQIIKPTWARLKSKLNLPDFSPDSQDAACIELIKEQGALSLVEQGKFSEAVARVRKVWASLPGAGYGQGERSIIWLQSAYTDAGGKLA